MKWPNGVSVGHTLGGYGAEAGARMVILDCPRKTLSPDEARAVARELMLRADFQERTPDTRSVNEIPVRLVVEPVLEEGPCSTD